jgi:hypothetical protein
VFTLHLTIPGFGLRCRGWLFQTHQNGGDAADHLNFLPVSPALTGRIGKHMWNQSQPFRILVKFAPAAKIASMCQKEIDWAIEFIRPLSPMSDRTSLSVDQDN